jgi:hypothetical protein
MIRRRAPFERQRRGTDITVNLAADERHLLRRLLGEVRELLGAAPADDPKMRRLFPPAYGDDTEASTEYSRLMRDELVASRVRAISTVDEFLADESRTTITVDELDTFAMSLNSVRLVLGTLLDIDEDDTEPPHADDPLAAESALYHFLSWLLDSAMDALSARR